MEIIWFLIIGIVAGWMAGVLFKGSGFGVVVDLIVGVVGAIIGGYLFRLLKINLFQLGLIGDLITAVVGAIILLAIVKMIKKR